MRRDFAEPRSRWLKAVTASIATIAVCLLAVRWLLPPEAAPQDFRVPQRRERGRGVGTLASSATKVRRTSRSGSR
ncbi:MAG: hypothetical protein AB7O38_10400 [Pirellulaceae bacterium]